MREPNFFGKNWKWFLQEYFNNERIENVKASLLEFLGEGSLEGKDFIASSFPSFFVKDNLHQLFLCDISNIVTSELSFELTFLEFGFNILKKNKKQ